MVFELVKNSLRAVQEHFVDSDKVTPPVRIIVADGLEDVTIKVLVVVMYRFKKYSRNCLREEALHFFFAFLCDNLSCHFYSFVLN